MLSFRLKFQTSQTTHLASSIISKRILKKLVDKKYEIEEMSKSNIVFGRPIFEIVWNFQTPYLLDGGNFEITESKNETTVVLNYFLKTLYSLFIFIVIMFVTVIQELYVGTLYLGIFFLIAAIIQFFTTKNVGEKLLRDIIDGNYKLDD